MNTSKAKSRLVDVIERAYRLEYSDETSVADGDEVLIYGRRRDSSNGVKWSDKDVARGTESLVIGEDVEDDPGVHQLVLRGTIHITDGDRRPFTFTDVEVEQASPIDKCKDDIKHKVIQLWRIAWPDMYLSGGTLLRPDENFHTTSPLEPVTMDDFKVTTVRADNKAMHLGWSSQGADYEFKLGVNWWSYHHASNTNRLKTLSHEIIHCKHQHHREEFYLDHARFVAALAKNEGTRSRVEALFGHINWNKLKTTTMDGVHSQPRDINISGYQNRREACNALVEELEAILDYRHDVGTAFHTHPPTDSLKSQWLHEYSHDDPEEDYPSRDELRPDGVEMVRVLDLEFDDSFSDEELYEYLQTLRSDEEVWWNYVYGFDDLPVVEDGVVVEKPELVALFKRMINESGVITEDGFTSDVQVPIRPSSKTKPQAPAEP